MEVAVGGRMVNDTRTTVTVTALTQANRVEGIRVEFVYLGLLGSDPAASSTIRVRYAEHKVANGVEAERPENWAEVNLDLSRGRTIEFKGWRIEVLEATDFLHQVRGRGEPRAVRGAAPRPGGNRAKGRGSRTGRLGTRCARCARPDGGAPRSRWPVGHPR